jgi:quinolinate synthase
MKKVELRKILRALEDPAPEQVIELAPETISKARRAIDRMLAVGRTERVK